MLPGIAPLRANDGCPVEPGMTSGENARRRTTGLLAEGFDIGPTLRKGRPDGGEERFPDGLWHDDRA
jgi:hypothetical protein